MPRNTSEHIKFYELCCLFCCPPCPTHIATKLAFVPPEPTYTLKDNQDDSHALSTVPEWESLTGDILSSISLFHTRTSKGKHIACMYVECAPQSKRTILYSHGNAVDLGHMGNFYYNLGSRLNCNIFSYDYSGYGASEGRPSEKNLYVDIEAAWQELLSRYNVQPQDVILYGQSIGTVPTVDLATKHEVGGVVLHSALTSGMRVAFPNTKRTWFFDSFPNIEKVPKVMSPVLVIHGTNDEIIDFSHAKAIYERCPRTVKPLWIHGAGHNDIELYGPYIERLQKFINEEITDT